MSHSNQAFGRFTIDGAGPLQVKRVQKAISAHIWRGKTERVLSGVNTGPDSGHVSEQTPMMGEPSAACWASLEKIGERYAWTISKKNAKALADDIAAETKALELVTVDQRRTPQEEADRLATQEANRRRLDAEQSQHAREKAQHVAELEAQYPGAVADDGKISSQARAAKNLKRELTQAFPGIAFSVRSDSFSMGDSVDVKWQDGPTAAQVKEIARKYQDSSFDSMQDMSTYDGSAYGSAVEQVLGRAKYVHESREISPATMERVGRLLCEAQGVAFDDLGQRGLFGPEDREELRYYVWRATQGAALLPGSQIVGVERTGACHESTRATHSLVVELTQETDAKSTQGADARSTRVAEVQKHYHDKRGKDFWLVVLADRVDRDRFEELRDDCQAAGGWYSRKWRKTPGGFAFTTEAQALAFADSIQGEATQGSDARSTGERPDVAARLRKLADGMQTAIDDGRRPMTQNPTPKRNREYLTRCHVADNMERGQSALRALADAHEAGSVPACLAGLRTKKDVLPLVEKGREHGREGYYDVIPSQDYRLDTPAARALQAMIDGSDASATAAAERRTALADLQFCEIPGFFPTPADVAARMVEEADIDRDCEVLEPSAGKGDLLAAIRAKQPDTNKVAAYEINPKLYDYLRTADNGDRAARLIGADFLAADPAKALHLYDRVVMNPPYERGAAFHHLRHAMAFLNPGGRVVCLIPDVGQERLTQELSGMLDEFEIVAVTPLGAAFKNADAFKRTAVNVAIVVVERQEVTQEEPTQEPPAAPTQAAGPQLFSPEAWRAKLWAVNGALLLGGVKLCRSTAFEDKALAEGYLIAALEINRASGVKCEGEIVRAE